MWNYADTGMALVMMPAIVATVGGLLLGHRKSMMKMRMAAAATDPAHLLVLTESARRMEQRIYHLESILDSEAPDWRRRSTQDGRVDVAY
jgi:phage shock protein B